MPQRPGTAAASSNVSRWNARTGPISTKRVSRDDAAGAAARDAPGGVRAAAVRRLGEPQLEALGEEQERVEEAARQRDVVVEHEQPVAAVERVRGEQRVEVLELAARRRRRLVRDLDVVARARAARRARRHQPFGASARSTPSTSTRRRGGARARRASSRHGGSVARRDARRAARPGSAARARAGRDRAATSPEPRRPAAPRDRAAGVERLAHPARRCGAAITIPLRAAAPRGVPDAAGERPQLGRQRRARRPCAHRCGARCGRGRRPRATARASVASAPRAPVVEAGGGDVADAPAGGAVARLPLLLVAAALRSPRRSRPTRLQRARGGSPCWRPRRTRRRGLRRRGPASVIGGALAAA